jgi:hypothetical protein
VAERGPIAEHQIRFGDGGAYEQNMGTWSRLAGDVFLDILLPPDAAGRITHSARANAIMGRKPK